MAIHLAGIGWTGADVEAGTDSRGEMMTEFAPQGHTCPRISIWEHLGRWTPANQKS